MGFEALDLGFYISFSGIVTFGKSDELRIFAKSVPQNRILVETDAPYLAPEPHRGRVNEPALVVHTCAAVAALQNVAPEDMAAVSRANFFNLFHKAKSGAVAP
jgi:TatD DNase family protein